MGITENKDVVTRFFQRMNAGDTDGAFALLDPECAWYSLSQRRFNSREQTRASVEWVNREFMDGPIVQTITALTAEDDRVAALTEGRAVTKAGVRYDNEYHFLFQLRDGLVVKLWEFTDTHLTRQVFQHAEGVGLDGS